ncbi:hypothetical protein L9F63_011983, partial [Diploptera punctata]
YIQTVTLRCNIQPFRTSVPSSTGHSSLQHSFIESTPDGNDISKFVKSTPDGNIVAGCENVDEENVADWLLSDMHEPGFKTLNDVAIVNK